MRLQFPRPEPLDKLFPCQPNTSHSPTLRTRDCHSCLPKRMPCKTIDAGIRRQIFDEAKVARQLEESSQQSAEVVKPDTVAMEIRVCRVGDQARVVMLVACVRDS